MYTFSSFSKILLSLLVCVSTLSALSPVTLDWEHNYAAALATAKKEKKTVYLFIGADVCKHCDRFKKQTLSNKELIQEMEEEYVLLYMSRDRHDIPDRFEIYGVPIHYFLTPEGKIIAFVRGSRELEGWQDVLDEVDLLKDK
jgi:uncharacterized protein YyaL (SSP411 family)